MPWSLLREAAMYNSGFYPTPAAVAAQMLSGIEPNGRTILEPSAGKGDLCDAIIKKSFWRYPEEARHKIHCCEIEPELQATLRGKGYTLVGSDFLTFQPISRYNLIVMNPPFRNGEKHLLHAWDILHEGDLVCLLNADSMRNAQVELIIEQHGEVVELGRCFEEAFRETSVNVAMVRLHKKAKPITFEVFGGVEDQDGTCFTEGGFSNQVATRDTIGNLVMMFDRAREVYARMLPLAAELKFYAAQLAPKHDVQWHKAAEDAIFSTEQNAAYNGFVEALKTDAWQKVFELTKVRNLMSAKVKEDFDKQKAEMLRMAFSEENISGAVYALMSNGPAILRQCVVEAFELMTSFDKKNKVHVEGWKTNDAWKVNRKVIVPVAVYESFSSWAVNGQFSYQYNEKLDDIDRAMAYLEGRKLEDVRTICQAVRDFAFPVISEPGSRNQRQSNPEWTGKKFHSEYFELVGYKKGTLHMTFRDPSLWKRFNIEAAKGKNWLPDDYKHRERAAKKGAVVPYA